jgi:hypothetical protein
MEGLIYLFICILRYVYVDLSPNKTTFPFAKRK